MSDATTSAGAVTATESARVAAAVEQVLAAEDAAAALTPTQKQAIAHDIYVKWRNANLNGIATSAFAQVEASSASLIAAIAAKL